MAVTITIGKLDKRLLFKQPLTATNEEGGIETTFTDAFTTWAFVREVKEFRKSDATGTSLESTKEFYIRYCERNKSISKDWQVVYNSKQYTLHEVSNVDEDHNYIKLTTKA